MVDLVIDIENTPGALARVAAAISDAGVNIAAATCVGPGERAELHILVPHGGAAKHSLAISHVAVTREREGVANSARAGNLARSRGGEAPCKNHARERRPRNRSPDAGQPAIFGRDHHQAQQQVRRTDPRPADGCDRGSSFTALSWVPFSFGDVDGQFVSVTSSPTRTTPGICTAVQKPNVASWCRASVL